MANDLERARVDISRYEDRCAKVEKELLEPLTEERRQKLESQLNLLLANLVELRKKENLAQEAQDRRDAAGARGRPAAGGGASAAGTDVSARGQDAEHQQRDQQQQQAAAAHVHAKVSCSNVVRLVDAGETVGSGCPVSFNGRSYLLASRHCMGLKPGQRIDVTSFTVCGHTLRHLASFPQHDVTVLLLDGGGTGLADGLRNATPFMVDGGIGLMPGIAVTLIGFPLAADKTVVGFQQSGLPLVAPGRVCWLSKAADEAICSYSGVFPNCSGGAVTFGPPHRYLAGMHTGIMWHEKGTNPRDIAPEAGPSGSGSGAPAAATAAGGELVVETDTWSGDSATGLAGQARACGGKRKPANRLEGVARDSEVQYCLDNVEHKSCMGTFVPAHVLVRLLSRCHELLAAAGALSE
ncbi:hypothetical protein CHLRE_12g492500v5 [Chlamydomonas reinhardtii]|uniref:Peptidase S1 domain-containing protein n=1 Tax=Chlamydomonas reinhardtii TaxID=3055 RepID=A0A2K3D1W0_CHLRE|nr:uncharacterized protein CHLRE_12g492500v5 [Chlamydomonas reinhardtii]PNW74528.1 hypothetical protein CHLRE_12g492500v5 [Chlamydomonas reinhardtii]